MKLILIAYRYLKKYPFFTILTVSAIVAASLFEGASFSMLIPLIQSMMAGATDLLAGIPFLGGLSSFLASFSQIKAISIIFLLMFLLLVLKNIFIYLSSVLITKLRFDIIRDLRVNLMGNLLEYDMKYFDKTKTGHIIGNINMETQRMGDVIQAVLQFIALSGRVIAYMVLLFLISWKASTVIFILIASVLIPIELIMKRVKGIGEFISRIMADYNYKLTEILGGLRLIKGVGTENEEKAYFEQKAAALSDSQYQSNKYMHLIIPLSEVFIFGLIVGCFLIIINFTVVNVTTTFPFIATYLLVLGRMLTQLNALNGRRSEAMKGLAAFSHYEDMHDARGKMTIISGDRKIDTFRDSIEFQHANFSYIKGIEVLRNINIKIPKGTITAFVGASGAGKSTIVNLIPRFYDVDSGAILIDGINVKALDAKAWRRKIGFVSQDIFIFNNSVRENIAYGHFGISYDEILRAAKAANAHDFILALSEGYDTMLGERGVRLSGGQKQRISITRAIIHNPEILILDEATSSLDTETERLITEAINRLTKDRTVIAIAHRLSTILHSDNIIVLDNGTVAEQGRHADLIEKSGLYKRLYDTQFLTGKGNGYERIAAKKP